MKTKLSWQTAGANARTLKMGDITSKVPAAGEILTISGEQWRVLGLESAVVVVEPALNGVAPDEPVLPKRSERVAQRLADEKIVTKPVHQTEHRLTREVHKTEPAKVVSHKKK